MACGDQEFWQHAHNASNHCPHPPIVHCEECRVGICSAHIVECEICEYFVCQDCSAEHAREHKREEQKNRRVA